MKKIKIGIVDDNQDFCEVVRDYLNKQNNIEVIFTAPDGIKAIEYLENENTCPDILILDLIMPHMDGFETLSRIKEKHNIPVVFMTGEHILLARWIAQ